MLTPKMALQNFKDFWGEIIAFNHKKGELKIGA